MYSRRYSTGDAIYDLGGRQRGSTRHSNPILVGSVKEGAIYKGEVGASRFEVLSPAGADGRTMATGMFFADNRLIVVGRQTGLIFVYDILRTGENKTSYQGLPASFPQSSSGNDDG
jgi:hypothetical protein